MTDRLNDALENVKDEITFRDFLKALAEDRRDSISDPDSRWQWDNIEDFLEAAANWSQDSERGLAQYQVPSNVWKRCADIIFSGKIYE
jgi:hypothetical protein